LAYLDWQDNPVLTSSSTTGLPIKELEFPTVSICSQGVITDILSSSLLRMFKDYMLNVKGWKTTMTPIEMSNAYKNSIMNKVCFKLKMIFNFGYKYSTNEVNIINLSKTSCEVRDIRPY